MISTLRFIAYVAIGLLTNSCYNTRRINHSLFKDSRKVQYLFKWSKCDFDAKEILILGVVIGREKVWIENDKVKAVTE